MDLIDLNENILLLFPQPIELLGVLEKACDLNRRHLICLPSLISHLGSALARFSSERPGFFLSFSFQRKPSIEIGRERLRIEIRRKFSKMVQKLQGTSKNSMSSGPDRNRQGKRMFGTEEEINISFVICPPCRKRAKIIKKNKLELLELWEFQLIKFPSLNKLIGFP